MHAGFCEPHVLLEGTTESLGGEEGVRFGSEGYMGCPLQHSLGVPDVFVETILEIRVRRAVGIEEAFVPEDGIFGNAEVALPVVGGDIDGSRHFSNCIPLLFK